MKKSLDVLIIYHEAKDYEAFKRFLENIPDYECRCTPAQDSIQAPHKLEHTHFDCVIMDYSRLAMDGAPLLKKLRSDLPLMPVVTLTGQGEDDLAAAALEAGANVCIDKTNLDEHRLHIAVISAITQCDTARASAGQTSIQFLIIDDSVDDREHYVRLLRSTRYRSARIVEAGSGENGLRYLRQQNFEAVLLDYSLPGMNGLEVLKQIRISNPFIPVILMTGQGNEAVAVTALQLGASDYLVKCTIDAERLHRAITGGIMKEAIAAKNAEIRAKTEELRASEERMRLLLGSLSKDAIYMLDVDGNVASWNVAAERIKGYTAEEIIGRHFSIFFCEDDIAAGEPARSLKVALEQGRYTTEAWRVRKDGRRFLASVAIEPIRGEDGSLRGFAKIAHDITQSRIEEEQRKIIVEANPNGILIVDESGQITLANSMVEQIFNYPSGALVGHGIESLLPEATVIAQTAIHPAHPDARAMGANFQVTGLRRDGSPITVEIALSPVETPRGRIVVVSLVDVTERLRREAERRAAEAREREAIEATNERLEKLSRQIAEARDRAEAANRAKSRFLTGISHELRTPLNGILGYAQLLRLEGGLNPTQLDRVNTMLESGRHLLGMINAVLDLAQIEADRIELKPSEINLPSLARACVELVLPPAQAKGLAVCLAPFPDRLPRMVADATRLRQVLVNLLGNAVKFTPAGSVELRLLTPPNSARVRLEVRDTGPGISAAWREQLFNEFERLDQADKGLEGSGLGLVITARLVHYMGGQIGYDDNPGGGSVFWVEFPAVADPVTADAGPGSPAAQVAARPPGLRVLVVDDMAINRDIAAGFLRHSGHHPVCADSGAAAIALAGAEDFDVILMDVLMPGMDGYEATRQIRALPSPRRLVPVVALTAQAFDVQVEAARRAGMNSHLSKPYEQPALVALVERLAAAPSQDWFTIAPDAPSQP